MRIITLNLNGIQSATRKGFLDWLALMRADVVCLQETRAQLSSKPTTLDVYCPQGYYCFYDDAEKKGYSGVAIYTRREPDRVTRGLGWSTADQEGRYIQVDFGSLSIASIYLPSGTSGEVRQAVKFDFMTHWEELLTSWRKKKRSFIIGGDLNIVHTERDIKNFKSNQKNSGCLPEERAWLDKVFTKLGWVDAFRVVNQETDQYTWWSNRGQAWAKNVGWRIDYQVVTPDLRDKVKEATIYKEQRFSDHAPVIIDYAMKWSDFE